MTDLGYPRMHVCKCESYSTQLLTRVVQHASMMKKVRDPVAIQQVKRHASQLILAPAAVVT